MSQRLLSCHGLNSFECLVEPIEIPRSRMPVPFGSLIALLGRAAQAVSRNQAVTHDVFGMDNLHVVRARDLVDAC
jgi:hypothetical protein